jgi:hypothetical protein
MQGHRRDSSTDSRLLSLCPIAAVIGGLSTVAAWTERSPPQYAVERKAKV